MGLTRATCTANRAVSTLATCDNTEGRNIGTTAATDTAAAAGGPAGDYSTAATTDAAAAAAAAGYSGISGYAARTSGSDEQAIRLGAAAGEGQSKKRDAGKGREMQAALRSPLPANVVCFSRLTHFRPQQQFRRKNYPALNMHTDQTILRSNDTGGAASSRIARTHGIAAWTADSQASP
ncbi:hypothetical protein [Aquabacter cavernae]|uniref:hypothetical protein n=1 Tax=Aquabacter cavernae TaxID=2496029 RepID=UPI0013DEA7B0|nr:hypothetical protein [Aquabacter cavernae]